MRRAARHLAVVASLGAACVACSTLLDLTPPPGAGDAGADAAAAADGGAPGDDGAPGDGGSPGAPDADFTFSDDFELGDLRRWTSTSVSAGDTLAVVDAGAYSGCCALQATTIAGGSSGAGAIETWPTLGAPPVTSGTIAVRERLKVLALSDDTREFAITPAGTGSDIGTGGIGAGSSGGFAWSVLVTDPANPSGDVGNSAATVPGADGQWHCAELVMNVSRSAGALSVFLDGQSVAMATLQTDTTEPAGWTSAQVGLAYSSGTSAANVLLDDVVIALYNDMRPRIHIGCGP